MLASYTVNTQLKFAFTQQQQRSFCREMVLFYPIIAILAHPIHQFIVQFCVVHPSTWFDTFFAQDVASLIAPIQFTYVELRVMLISKLTYKFSLSLTFVLMVLQTPHFRLTELLSNRDWIDRR